MKRFFSGLVESGFRSSESCVAMVEAWKNFADVIGDLAELICIIFNDSQLQESRAGRLDSNLKLCGWRAFTLFSRFDAKLKTIKSLA